MRCYKLLCIFATASCALARTEKVATANAGSLALEVKDTGSASSSSTISTKNAASHRLLVRREAPNSSAKRETEFESTPVLNCEVLRGLAHKADAPAYEKERWTAVKELCEGGEDLAKLLEVRVDSRFRGNYDRIYNGSGWVDEAYVNYVKVTGPGTEFGRLTEALVDSIHRFSSRPILVFNFGSVAPPELLDANRFPRLVLLHAHPVSRVSFNFNKLLAVLVGGVKTGVSVDSDMMVGPHADRLFERTRDEVTQLYPYPMLPTHYLDRDTGNKGKGRKEATNFLAYDCPGCPKPTLRWGQAHPTWTYWALPFIGRWLTARLKDASVGSVQTRFIGEDEDLLNVALWSENATKAWCLFQPNGAEWVEQNFLAQHAPGPEPFYEDPSRFPEGVPIGFYMIHGEKKVAEVYKAMDVLEKRKEQALLLPAMFHKRRFYSNFTALEAANPGLRCKL